jgi:hypothetical protein
MTHLPEIWSCLKLHMHTGRWFPIEELYRLIENHLSLDTEDYAPQSPSSDIPKWKRNVRNVLQYRKKTGEIEWDGAANYRI